MRSVRSGVLTLGVLATLAGARVAPVGAQEGRATPPGWNDERTRQVVALATARRAQQLADTGLVDYQAVARGYLTFLAQLGEGFTEPPQVVKADQLALEVYWKAPNLSKQRIVGRRDTLLLPTDIQYHRDHLGIVQNNFPDIIRLGDGDEVRDVPHPLSPRGLEAYDFAVADSLRITIPGRGIDVYEVKVRPRDDRQARIIGSLFIDRAEGQVVRMAFNFTRAAFLDRNLEDLSIVLENRLVSTRFWLPSRQEIEIRRTGRWLDFPARGIIRGRWEIGDYRVNQGFAAAQFTGPEIVQAPRAEQAAYPWQGRILDSLPPDVRATSDADIARVQAEARALVRAQALQRVRRTALAGRAASEFVRFDRAQGLSLGAGVRQGLGTGFALSGRARYGLDDHDAKGTLALSWQDAAGRGARLYATREHAQAGDVAERSGVVNSIAAQELGSDWTDPYERRAAGLELDAGRLLGARWSVAASAERHEAVRVRAHPAFGRFEPTLAVAPAEWTRLALAATVPTRLAVAGTELSARAELSWQEPLDDCALVPAALCRSGVRRGSLDLSLERPIGATRLVTRTTGAAVAGRALPVEQLAFFGGPVTAPGYDFHAIAATAGLSQRVEWRLPVPFVAIPLGRFGRVPARATLAPFAHLVLARPVEARIRGDSATSLVRGRGGAWRGYPSVGVGALTLFDLLRLDVARGLRDGRWIFSLDVSREFWRVL